MERYAITAGYLILKFVMSDGPPEPPLGMYAALAPEWVVIGTMMSAPDDNGICHFTPYRVNAILKLVSLLWTNGTLTDSQVLALTESSLDIYDGEPL